MKLQDSLLQKKKILIADSDPNRFKLYQEVLMPHGFDLVFCSKSDQVFEKFLTLQPSLVILDLALCENKRFDLVSRIKQSNAGELFAPVVLASDESENLLLQHVLDKKADGFLKIPFSSGVLLSKLQSLLRMRSLYAALKESRDKIHELHQNLQQEHKSAERIYEKFVRPSSQDIAGFRSYISSASIFNGDLLLARVQPSGDVLILMGDFTGHGLSAAIGVIPVAEMFNGMVSKSRSVPEIIVEVNSKLHKILPAHLFFGCSILQISPSQRKARIYNCGMPNVLMSKPGHPVQNFASKNLPLGVVESRRLDLYPDCVNLEGDEVFYLLTDGLIESRNPAGEMFGYQRVEEAISSGPIDGVEQLIQQASTFCDGQFFEDDVSIAELRVEPILSFNYIDSLEKLAKATKWKLQFEFDHVCLKQMTRPMEGVVDMIMQLQPIPSHKERIAIVLEELFNNALDHGVLGLDSSLKQKEDGFLKFLSKRQSQLENLSSGSIDMTITHQPLGDYEGELVIKIHDSGNGFDFNALSNSSVMPEKAIFSGRGIMLVKSLCTELSFQGKGNAVKAVYRWNLRPDQ
jgi:CheY-like chemotaxis protein/anti-sigma regulatory factor (Ser/Thr protein kinase)